jgi:hypothetical protein
MALDVPAAERQQQYEAAGKPGGATPMLVAYADLLASREPTKPPPSSSATRSARS